MTQSSCPLSGLHIALVACMGILLILPAAALIPDIPAEPGTATGAFHEIVISNTTSDRATIRFRTDTACIPEIHYYPGPVTGMSEERITHGIMTCTTHAITLANLVPDTRYNYRISGCSNRITEGSFITFPAEGACSFVVYGDTREQMPLYLQTSRHSLVADRIAGEEGIRFVVNSGDLVTNSSDCREWMRFFTATETLRARTTYRAVPGNHDQDRARFRDIFGSDGFAYFDCGNARIILLDSTIDAEESFARQALRLSSASAGFAGAKIVILHHPPYSSDENHYGGWLNIQEDLVPVLEKSGVSLVFSSHVHAFEQVDRSGITYITEARGGAPSYPLNRTRISGSIRAYENTLGYSRINVDPVSRTIQVDVIRVADVSPDLRTLTRVYPAGTTDASILIPFGDTRGRIPAISAVLGMMRFPRGAARWNGRTPSNLLNLSVE